MFKALGREVEDLIDDAIQISYFMRGAISYEGVLERTPGERQRIGKFIEKRLDAESKSPHPIY